MDFLIVGLGNPGDTYTYTRHNVGFMALQTFQNGWEKDAYAKAFVAQEMIARKKVIIAKPQTFMNNSGETVSYLVKKYSLLPSNVIVLCDDIDLPLGSIRISRARGSGGHNGLRSIEAHLHSNDFIRIRIGVSRADTDGNAMKPKGGLFTSKKKAVANFVLKNFTPGEQKTLETIFPRVKEAFETIIRDGVEKAMNTYN